MKTYTKHALFLMVTLFSFATIFGQTKEGMKALAESRYDEAKLKFESSLEDPVESPIGHYGLSLLYLDSVNGVQLDQAYYHAVASQNAFRKVPYKKRKKLEKRFTAKKGAQLEAQIVESAFEEALALKTLDGYDYFLTSFRKVKPAYKRQISEARNAMLFQAAQTANNYESYATLYKENGNSLSRYSPATYREVESLLWQRFLSEKGLSAYDEFATNFSKHQVVAQGHKPAFDAAVEKGNFMAYEAFVKANPNSAFEPMALDSMVKETNRVKKMGLYKRFFDQFGDRQVDGTAWRNYYQAFLGAELLPSKVAYFKKQYPNYPFPEDFEADQNRALDSLAHRIYRKNALPGYAAFIKKNPEYHNIDTMWMKYYEAYKDQHHELKDLNKFKAIHPDFPYSDLLAQDRAVFKEKELAYKSQQMINEGDLTQIMPFLNEYPSPNFMESLEPRVYQYVSRSPLVAHKRYFLEKFPDSQHRDSVYLEWYYLATNRPNVQLFEKFKEDNPDFPFPNLIESDVALLNSFAEKDLSNLTAANEKDLIRLIKGMAPRNMAVDYLKKWIKKDFERKDWQTVRNKVTSCRESFGDHNPRYNQLFSMVAEQSVDINARSISNQINSPEGDEFSPTITTDGQRIYFCGKFRDNSIGGEDIFYADLVDGKWNTPEPVPVLNSGFGHEAPEAITADGTAFMIFKNGNLELSDKTKDGWGNSAPLPKAINRSNWQADAVFTADGNALLFASEGEGLGGRDIFVSVKDEQGDWQKAINLGFMINTKGSDRSPFLHPDMKTLYFSSDGHEGFGGLDVFMSRRLDESWTNWSEPINLGYLLNNDTHNWGYSITTNGKNALYAEQRGAKSRFDLIICDLPEAYQPDPVSTVAGKLVDQSGAGIDANIIWKNLETKETFQVTRSDPENGRFFATMPKVGKFSYTVKKEGYFPISGYIEIEKPGDHIIVERSLQLATIEDMENNELRLPLNNVFFDTDDYTIQSTSYPELDNLAEWLLTHDLTIQLRGHTDNVGDNDYNLRLSDDRVKAVRNYLIVSGCDAEKITAKGFGETVPIASNDTENGRAQNRRVEIQLIKQ